MTTLEKPLLGREAKDTRLDLAYGTRTDECAHALLNTTLSTAETNELSGPCYVSLPANAPVYHHRKELTLRVYRAELAMYCCANYFESSWTHKFSNLARLEVCEPFALHNEDRI